MNPVPRLPFVEVYVLALKERVYGVGGASSLHACPLTFGFYSGKIKGMVEDVFEPIEVEASFSHGNLSPTAFFWGKKSYPVEKIIFSHQRRQGRSWLHYFSLLHQETVYEVFFDPEHFSWTLARIHLPGA